MIIFETHDSDLILVANSPMHQIIVSSINSLQFILRIISLTHHYPCHHVLICLNVECCEMDWLERVVTACILLVTAHISQVAWSLTDLVSKRIKRCVNHGHVHGITPLELQTKKKATTTTNNTAFVACTASFNGGALYMESGTYLSIITHWIRVVVSAWKIDRFVRWRCV